MKHYTRTNNAVYNLGYHITWCPKYRKSFLLQLDQNFLKRSLQLAAIKIQGVVENVEIMPDHIHLFVRLKSSKVSVSRLVQALKGYSSYAIKRKYTWMQKYKALWSAGYFAESVGNMSAATIKKYIANQKVHLKPNYHKRV